MFLAPLEIPLAAYHSPLHPAHSLFTPMYRKAAVYCLKMRMRMRMKIIIILYQYGLYGLLP